MDVSQQSHKYSLCSQGHIEGPFQYTRTAKLILILPYVLWWYREKIVKKFSSSLEIRHYSFAVLNVFIWLQ